MKQFDELSEVEKVKAVLLAIREPLPLLSVIDFAGLIGELDPNTTEVFDVFKDPDLTIVTIGNTNLFKYDDRLVNKAMGINMQSVHRQIADVMIRQLGIK